MGEDRNGSGVEAFEEEDDETTGLSSTESSPLGGVTRALFNSGSSACECAALRLPPKSSVMATAAMIAMRSSDCEEEEGGDSGT